MRIAFSDNINSKNWVPVSVMIFLILLLNSLCNFRCCFFVPTNLRSCTCTGGAETEGFRLEMEGNAEGLVAFELGARLLEFNFIPSLLSSSLLLLLLALVLALLLSSLLRTAIRGLGFGRESARG